MLNAGMQTHLYLPFPDAEKFADFALNTQGLVLATSSNYFGAGRSFVRIPYSYSYSEKHTVLALEKLASCLENY